MHSASIYIYTCLHVLLSGKQSQDDEVSVYTYTKNEVQGAAGQSSVFRTSRRLPHPGVLKVGRLPHPRAREVKARRVCRLSFLTTPDAIRCTPPFFAGCVAFWYTTSGHTFTQVALTLPAPLSQLIPPPKHPHTSREREREREREQAKRKTTTANASNKCAHPPTHLDIVDQGGQAVGDVGDGALVHGLQRLLQRGQVLDIVFGLVGRIRDLHVCVSVCVCVFTCTHV